MKMNSRGKMEIKLVKCSEMFFHTKKKIVCEFSPSNHGTIFDHVNVIEWREELYVYIGI